MVPREFLRKKAELFKRLRGADELTGELERGVIETYGSRGERALKVVKSGGVRKEGGQWFVRGKKKEYEIVRTYCACYDYVLNVVTGKAGVDMCYHALAKTICELLGAHYR